MHKPGRDEKILSGYRQDGSGAHRLIILVSEMKKEKEKKEEVN